LTAGSSLQYNSDSHEGDDVLRQKFTARPAEPVQLGIVDVSTALSIPSDVMMLLLALAFVGNVIGEIGSKWG
jgi:ATP phosphoribosyltransferase regulatory subunit HisZ